ncbi:MAG: FHA domain-containing protein [Labilithrix sp.]|nr:FHA domain-containing protein [Labilithrix sp.]
MATLIVRSGDEVIWRGTGSRWRLAVGRDPSSDLVLRSARVSRDHALIEAEGDRVIVSDRASTTGTFVNTVRIDRPAAIGPGDRVIIGDHTLRIELEPDEPEPMTNPMRSSARFPTSAHERPQVSFPAIDREPTLVTTAQPLGADSVHALATPLAVPVSTPLAAPVATPLAAPVATPLAAPVAAGEGALEDALTLHGERSALDVAPSTPRVAPELDPAEQRFLARLREAPDDDATRRDYAEWLERRGQRIKAQYLRLQCALAAYPDDGHPEALAIAERARAIAPTSDAPWRALAGRPAIERCDAGGAECPKRWSRLTSTGDDAVRRCAACRRDVFFCATLADVQRRGDRKERVTLDASLARSEALVLYDGGDAATVPGERLDEP